MKVVQSQMLPLYLFQRPRASQAIQTPSARTVQHMEQRITAPMLGENPSTHESFANEHAVFRPRRYHGLANRFRGEPTYSVWHGD